MKPERRGGISGTTRVVGIIGDPVAHTRSPAMHNAAFAALDLDYVYVAFRVRSRDLRSALAGLKAAGVAGLNVTVPHKERIARLVDEVTPRASLIGAVNTISRRGLRFIGDNTDGAGFATAVAEAGCRVRGARAVVIGAGGAARAVAAGLVEGGAGEIVVVNRRAPRRLALARSLARRGRPVRTAGLAALMDRRLLATADLIVNATSIGWHNEPFPPLAYEATPPQCLFFDLTYGRNTRFLAGAAKARRPRADGAGMLLHQGAAAFEAWTGRPAPLPVMARALGLGS